ncbi:hypothetical protein V1511DRAFT_529845 [Dipodascopsis uninucleata]
MILANTDNVVDAHRVGPSNSQAGGAVADRLKADPDVSGNRSSEQDHRATQSNTHNVKLSIWSTAGQNSLLAHDETNPVAVLLRRLSVKPGERGFLMWYNISNSFPIVAASIGPVSNLNSVAALADSWRIDISNDDRPGDLTWMLCLNAISLFLGCCANISLFLNFSGRVNYIYAQTISIVGWYCACILLVVLLISSQFVYFRHENYYSKSEGYWHGLYTCIFYFLSASLLLINYLGHIHGIYSASFNLTPSQRRIMLHNVMFVLWIGLGGLLFSFLIDIRYTDALYYCVVTITTIGLGDIVPRTTVARALLLPYALGGVIILGVLVTTITSLVIASSGQAVIIHRAERLREQHYERILTEKEHDNPIAPSEAYELIRKIHRQAKRQRKVTMLFWVITAFSMFWLLGAMIFHFVEGWTYFESIYFCSLCLLTIGYGDFTPRSAVGRSFFILWAIGAVPMMTVLIASLSDNLFLWIIDISDAVTVWLLAVYSVRTEYTLYWKMKSKSFLRRLLHLQDSSIDADTSSNTIEVIPDEDEEVVVTPTNEDNTTVLDVTNTVQASLTDGRAHSTLDGHSLSHNVSGSSRSTNHELRSIPRQSSTNSIDAFNAKTHRMLRTIQEIRILGNIAAHEPEKHFTYDEWKHVASLISGRDLDEVDPSFWLSEKSPVRYPLPQVRYLLNKCLEALELEVNSLLKETS